jgi:IS5 family transposase
VPSSAKQYAAPKSTKEGPKSLDEVDPKLLETYEKLGIPLREREKLAGIAVDAVFDSVSVATTLQRSKGGQFALHAMALPGNPYDGHTLATIIPDIERTIGNGITRILADAGYRGHNAPLSHKFKVFTSGQKRRMTPAIKREMRRRSAVEPVIGHIKNGHRMDRNYLAGPQGDAINAVLAAAGYNFRLLLNWLRLLLCLIASLILLRSSSAHRPQMA